jgi:hypothetical protein
MNKQIKRIIYEVFTKLEKYEPQNAINLINQTILEAHINAQQDKLDRIEGVCKINANSHMELNMIKQIIKEEKK